MTEIECSFNRNISHIRPRSARTVPNLVCLSIPRWEGLHRSRLALFIRHRPPGRGACDGMGKQSTGVSATVYTDSLHPCYISAFIAARPLVVFLPPPYGLSCSFRSLPCVHVAVLSSFSLSDTRQQCSSTRLNGVDPFVPY